MGQLCNGDLLFHANHTTNMGIPATGTQTENVIPCLQHGTGGGLVKGCNPLQRECQGHFLLSTGSKLPCFDKTSQRLIGLIQSAGGHRNIQLQDFLASLETSVFHRSLYRHLGSTDTRLDS